MDLHVARSAVLLAVVLCATLPSQATRPEDDTFSSASVDSCRWLEWSNRGTASQSNGLRLQTSAADSFSSARLISQYMIKGDVTMEVEVTAGSGFETSIPDSAQMYASLGLWADDQNFLFIALGKSADRTVIRALKTSSARGFEVPPDVPISGSSARLRISQSAGQVTLWYNASGTWSLVTTFSAFPESYVSLAATTVDVQRQFVANFAAFSVTSGTTSYRQYSRAPLTRRADFWRGASIGDFMDYRIWGTQWRNGPLQQFAENGMNMIATDVTTVSAADLARLPVSRWGELAFKPEYWRSKEITAQLLKEAAARGFKLYLQLYLSDGPAHYGKQNAPPEWRGLSLEQTAERVRAYTRSLVESYRAQGLRVGVFAVGNEIENGIVGFYPDSLPGGRVAVPPGVASNNLTFLRTTLWPQEATLLKAAIEGIRAADPEAKIVLHAAGMDYSPSDVLTKAFFKSMVDNGVPFDYAGISHPYAVFPWNLNRYTTDCWLQRIQETSDYFASLGKKTIIAEGSYPRRSGAYANPPLGEFPFNDEGQAGWVRELLRFGNNNPNMAGFLYWAADYYVGMAPADGGTVPEPQYSGLFDAQEQPVAALREFAAGQSTGSPNAPGPYSGIWWNPGESGWGINFTQRNGNIFAAWYTYDGGGKPKWYVASSCAMSGNGCSGLLYEVSGPRFFGTAFDPSSAHAVVVGNLQVAFATQDAGTLSYSLNGQTRTIAIARQIFQSGTTSPAVDYTDLWWNSAESGWGLAVTQQYGIMFLAWFVYDASGMPIWYVASNCVVAANGCAGTLFSTTGPAFGPSFDPARVNVVAVGSVSLSFSDSDNGTLVYTVNGVSGSKAITRQIF